MKIGKHPPLSRLALRVGVSGHREIAEQCRERIKSDLELIFGTFDRTVDELAERYARYYAQPPLKRLISPLAAGADTLAAEVAQTRGYSIQAPLPFAVEDYAQDFKDHRREALRSHLMAADSIFELNGKRDGQRTEESSYLAAGYLTLRQCDVLIAIWDGKAARGIGGTAMVVEAAVQRGVPVVWVHSEDSTPPCLLRDDLLFGAPIEQLRSLTWQSLAPPFLPEDSSGQDSFDARSKLCVDQFYREGERRQNFGIFYQLFQSLVTFKSLRRLSLRHRAYAKNTAQDWRVFNEEVGAQNPVAQQRIDEVLAPRFSWADGLANHYAEIYRSSYVLNYFLGAVAVLFALMSLLVDGKEIWVMLELVAALLILAITHNGRRRRWHERWIDYRQLAEQLRHLRFLYLTGGSSPTMAPRHHYDSGRSEGGWVQWYYQSTVRELGLASAKATPEYLEVVKRLFLDEEITGQIAYHERNAHQMHKFEHALHMLSGSLFGLTTSLCAISLTLLLLGHFEQFHWTHDFIGGLKYKIVFLSALLPAVAAAMSGIRVQGEFASTSERSEAMAARLSQLQTEIDADAKAGDTGLARLRSFIETTSETMLIEVVDWRFVFRGKPLSLPA